MYLIAGSVSRCASHRLDDEDSVWLMKSLFYSHFAMESKKKGLGGYGRSGDSATPIIMVMVLVNNLWGHRSTGHAYYDITI